MKRTKKRSESKMTNEKYVLVVWNNGVIQEFQGLYPNNEETFEYVKQILLEDLQEGKPHITIVPHDLETIEELYTWYWYALGEATEFWSVAEVSPTHAPKRNK